MPWQPRDATRHTAKATTAKLRRMWAHVANQVLKDTKSEARAVRAANAAVAKEKAK